MNMPPVTLAELERQETIYARQLQQYINARPRQRFAYAAHMTKTTRKINFILSNLHGDDLKAALARYEIDLFNQNDNTKENA